jgi:TolB protein
MIQKLSLVLSLAFLFACCSSVLAEERIAYSGLSEGYWQLWTISPNGTNKQKITSSPFDKREPAWCHNGEGLVFRTNNGELWMVDLKTQIEQRVLTNYPVVHNPHYCDATGEIVFVRFAPSPDGGGFIWKTDLKDKYPVVLTREGVLKYQPSFSWQCDKIAFVKADLTTASHHIWIMDADGNNQAQVTEHEGLFTLPAFSPDQKTFVMTANRNTDNYDIYTLDLATKTITQLTKAPGLDTHAKFSPDGESIVFVSNRSGTQQIWVMDKNGRNLKQVTPGPEECVAPVWGHEDM